MKEFLKNALIEPFSDDGWLGIVVGSFMWLVTLIFSGLIIWLGVWLIDSSFLPEKQKDGVITDKYIIPAHSTTTWMMSGKTMIPITTYHDTEYDVTITIDGLTEDMAIDESYFDEFKIDQKVHCCYTNGRILNSLYIKSFYP